MFWNVRGKSISGQNQVKQGCVVAFRQLFMPVPQVTPLDCIWYILENGSHTRRASYPNQKNVNNETILIRSMQATGIVETRLLEKLEKTREAKRRRWRILLLLLPLRLESLPLLSS